jgi:dihydrofolate reductase
MYQQNRINFLSDYYNNKRKFKIYSLVTLNGKVANEDGVNSWIEKLPNPEQTDYEFNNFYDSIDTIILDEKMYDNIINNYETFPYVNKNAIVFTGNNSNYTDTNSIKFLKYSEIDKLQNKFNDEGKDIWVLSTGYVNSLLFKYNLIDEVNLYYIPIIAPKGIDITEIIPVEKYFRLKNGKTYKSGVVELKYVAGKIR